MCIIPVIILLLTSSACAQVELNRTCNFTGLIAPLNASTIAGRWYQRERIENTFDAGDCSTTTFTVVLSGGLPSGLEFSNREVVGGRLVYRNASVTSSRTGYGVLNFTFADGDSNDYVILPVPYYKHESIVLYSCQDNGNWSSVWAWKLGKNLMQSAEAQNATTQLVASLEDLANATWTTTSFSEAACKVNKAVKHLILTPFYVVIATAVVLDRI